LKVTKNITSILVSKTSGTVYDDTNTVISTDWTCFGNTKFSLDSTGNGEQLEDNWDADNDFYGIVVYFETYGEQEEGSGQSFSAFERGGNFWGHSHRIR